MRTETRTMGPQRHSALHRPDCSERGSEGARERGSVRQRLKTRTVRHRLECNTLKRQTETETRGESPSDRARDTR
eukprot:3597377-Rhodomonas_salina.1